MQMNIGFPYMLSEGNSCIYGGLYIVQSISSRDSEILSLCTSTFSRDRHICDFNNISVIIIHYSEYSSERIRFYAKFFYDGPKYAYLNLNPTYKEDTLSITIPSESPNGVICSYQFKLRKIHYINISLNANRYIEFNARQRASCINITIFYPKDMSNVLFVLDQYSEEGSKIIYNQTQTISGHRTFW